MNRSGFGLVELLITIAIIGMLGALLMLAIGPTLESARVAATRTTIAQINDVVQRRIEAVNQADLRPDAKRLVSQLRQAGVTNVTEKQAEFILRKNLLRVALPQSVEDFYGLNRQLGGDDDLFPQQIQPPASVPPEEVFFIAITQVSLARPMAGSKGITLPILELDNINKNHIDEDRRFVDDWGNPLRFYRWTTGLFRDENNQAITLEKLAIARGLISGLPAATQPIPYDDYTHQLNVDPDDPTGTLSGRFMNDPLPSSANPLVLQFFPENYHHVNTYTVPLIVSAGPDGELGLEEPDATGPARLCSPLEVFDGVFDNVTNRQQQ